MAGDPREAWQNLQKNLQRMQQQGKRYAYTAYTEA